MGNSARGHRMSARRRKRYERINPIYEHRDEILAARTQHDILTQSGIEPTFEKPSVDQWRKDIAQAPPGNQIHKREDIDADVEQFKRENNFPY